MDEPTATDTIDKQSDDTVSSTEKSVNDLKEQIKNFDNVSDLFSDTRPKDDVENNLDGASDEKLLNNLDNAVNSLLNEDVNKNDALNDLSKQLSEIHALQDSLISSIESGINENSVHSTDEIDGSKQSNEADIQQDEAMEVDEEVSKDAPIDEPKPEEEVTENLKTHECNEAEEVEKEVVETVKEPEVTAEEPEKAPDEPEEQNETPKEPEEVPLKQPEEKSDSKTDETVTESGQVEHAPEPMETNEVEPTSTTDDKEEEKMDVDEADNKVKDLVKEKSNDATSETTEKQIDHEDSSQSAIDTPSEKNRKNTDEAEPGPSNTDKETSNNEDETSMEENPMFVTVGSKETEDAEEKDQDSQIPDENETSAPEEDPIGVAQPEKEDESLETEDTTSEKEPVTVVSKESIDDIVQGKGADEELCIIPDTEREISQEEKDAATAASKADSPKPAEKEDTVNENSTETDTQKTNNVEDVSKMQGKISVINHVSEAPAKSDEMKVIALTDSDLAESECVQCKTVRIYLYLVTLVFIAKI